jgi:soluble lytic murein transglycosylase-like protein
VLIVLTCLLFFGSFAVTQKDTLAAYAAETVEANQTCIWHRVVPGDTLGDLAFSYHSNVWHLARINHIHNVDLIFVGQNLCIDSTVAHKSGSTDGMLPNGSVRWYAYDSLDWSNKAEVANQLRQAAARYGLPANLLLAIAWQESGWNQHVISYDGGIGVMQIMPYTAYGLDRQTGMSYNPYKLSDNIELGAIYLRSLMNGFHGNLNEVISGYNEGGWSVIHRGIFNWNYVRSVQSLMKQF